MGLSRFSREDDESINHFVNYFGEDVFRYFVVLFTRKDDLEYEGLTLDDHFQTIPQNLRTIIDKCGGRCIAFNNRAKGQARDDQVKDLLEIINDVVRQNHGTCYTNEMYNKAEKVMEARQCEIEKQRKRERETERQTIEHEIEQSNDYQYGSQYKNQNDIEQKKAVLESKQGEMRAYSGSEKEFEMQNEIKELKQEIRRMKDEAEKKQKEKEMVLQERLKQLDQKYMNRLNARQVAIDELANGDDLFDTLIGAVYSVGKRIFNKLIRM